MIVHNNKCGTLLVQCDQASTRIQKGKAGICVLYVVHRLCVLVEDLSKIPYPGGRVQIQEQPLVHDSLTTSKVSFERFYGH